MARYKSNGCRCDICRAAIRHEQRARYRAKAVGTFVPTYVNACGTRRRVEALMTLGYAPAEIAANIGLARNNVSRLINDHRDTVRQTTRDAVARFYDLAWRTPSTHRYAARTVNLAAKRGYLPPMSWDDDTIDDPLAEPHRETPVDVDWLMVSRAVNGEKRGRRLTAAERQAAMLVMAQQGHTATGISRVLSVNGTDARKAVEAAA